METNVTVLDCHGNGAFDVGKERCVCFSQAYTWIDNCETLQLVLFGLDIPHYVFMFFASIALVYTFCTFATRLCLELGVFKRGTGRGAGATGKAGRVWVFCIGMGYSTIRLAGIFCNSHKMLDTCPDAVGDLLWQTGYLSTLTVHMFSAFTFLRLFNALQNPFAKARFSTVMKTTFFMGGVSLLAFAITLLNQITKYFVFALAMNAIYLVNLLYFVYLLWFMGKNVIHILKKTATSDTSSLAPRISLTMMVNMQRYIKNMVPIGIGAMLIIIGTVVVDFSACTDAPGCKKTAHWIGFVFLIVILEITSVFIILRTVTVPGQISRGKSAATKCSNVSTMASTGVLVNDRTPSSAPGAPRPGMRQSQKYFSMNLKIGPKENT